MGAGATETRDGGGGAAGGAGDPADASEGVGPAGAVDAAVAPDAAGSLAEGTRSQRLRDAIETGTLRPIPETLGPATPASHRPAVDVVGVDPNGEPVHVPVTGGTGRWLLVFLSDDCQGCELFWTELAAWRGSGDGRLPADVRPVAITKGPGRVSAERLKLLSGPDPVVPVVLSDSAWDDYAVLAYPGAVVVGRADVRGATPAAVAARVQAKEAVFAWGDVLALVRA